LIRFSKGIVEPTPRHPEMAKHARISRYDKVVLIRIVVDFFMITSQVQ